MSLETKTKDEALKLAIEAMEYPIKEREVLFDADKSELLLVRAINTCKEALNHQWQELTDDDVQAMWKFYEGKYYDFYTAIEQALKEKNGL